MGPDFQRPESPPNAGYTPTSLPATTASAQTNGGEAQRFAIGRDIQFDWWTLFQSPALNKLEDPAHTANPTENVYGQQGYFFPTLTAGYTFERQQIAGNLGGNSPGLQGNGNVIAGVP